MNIRILLVSVLVAICVPHTSAESAKAILDDLIRDDYVMSDPPGINDGQTTELKVGIYANSFGKIDTAAMEYKMGIYFRQEWTDPRLQFDGSRLQSDEGFRDVKKITLPVGSHDKIWTPDTFFRNAKEMEVRNRLLVLRPSGKLWYVQQISVTLSCPMKLQKFPFDTQKCPLIIESFGHTMDTLYFNWLESPVDIDSNLELLEYTLEDVILFDCSQNYTAGAFPCLEIQFVLERDHGYYITQVFVPCILIVILSWAAFWVDLEHVTARALIGLACFFAVSGRTMTTGQITMASYTKAIDVWMIICVLFTMFAFLQILVVLFFKASESPEKEDHGGEKNDQGGEKKSRIVKLVDIGSKIGFPCLFLFFNIIYWSVYCG